MNDVLQRTKICFIVGTLSQGGAERQLYYMLRMLREQGNIPTVLCLTRGEFWESRIRELGVPIIWVGQNGARTIRLLKIINKVRRLKPDILQSSHFYTNLYAAFTGMFFGIPAIGTMRNDCISEVRATGKIFGMLNLKVPRMIAGNSMLGIQNAKTLGVHEKRLFFLPNAIDCSAFPPFERNGRSQISLLAAGRLVEQKRMDRFLRIVAQLRKQVAVTGVIVGDGPLRSQLQAQAALLGLDSDVLQFRGVESDMNTMYKEADIFLLTSDWEGTPNVVLEAMSTGLPVVATKVGGVADIIETGMATGFVVEKDDEEGMIHCVKRLVSDSRYRQSVGSNASRLVGEKFSIGCLGANLGKLYENAAAVG